MRERITTETRHVPALIVLLGLSLGVCSAAAQEDEAPAGADAGPDIATERDAIDTPAPSESPGASPEAVKKTVTIMGYEVIPRAGDYRVTADANVRMGPGTNHERIDGVREGDRIQVIGKAEGTAWFAVSREGKTIGFVFQNVLKSVVDATIGEEIRNRITTGDVACDYRLRFEGRNEVEGADFDTADYEVLFRCASQLDKSIFYAHMFMTEGPVDRSGRFHQISFETRSVGDGLETYLTSNYHYDPAKGELQFVGHSLPRYALPPDAASLNGLSTQAALVSVVEATIASWTPAAWQSLFSRAD